jgi:hydrogenase expression/formation protein HypD
MKYIDEYRDPAAARGLRDAIGQIVTRPWTIMEVCGGQTHTILRYGLDRLLPANLKLIHGPGCPVCVTAIERIDKAIEIAYSSKSILASFGDMLRVPGSGCDLLTAKAAGADVRLVYSPLDAVRIAAGNPAREVVFFAVGFETTAPTTALAVLQAKREGVRNFSLLAAHVRVPPAIQAILHSPSCRVQGFLAPGHVCTVMGFNEYEALVATYRVPIVVTGFEPLDLLQGIRACVTQLEEGRADVENAYGRAVRREGNPRARRLIDDVFRVADRNWRGLGCVPDSGFALADAYRDFDAERRFGPVQATEERAGVCKAGQVLQGLCRPVDCEAFGSACTPDQPLGAPMVSGEGACAAYYRYRGRTKTMPTDETPHGA